MKKLSVLVSLITDNNDFQLEQASAAQTAAVQLGVDVKIIYAGNDAVQQTQQILSFIQDPARRPDAILVEPVGTGMPQIARAAAGAGTGWGILNTDVDYLSEIRRDARVPAFSLLADHEATGRIQAQQVKAILGEKGCVLYIEGPAVRDAARIRSKGMFSNKPPGIDVKTLRGLDTE